MSRKRAEITDHVEVQEAIRGLKLGKEPEANGIPIRAPKHIPQRMIPPLLLKLIISTQHFG